MTDFKALVVDDSEPVRSTLVNLLAKIGITAQAYETAEELLCYLFPTAVIELSDMPDLIIIDLQLKKDFMQGFELISELVSPRKNVPSSLMAISGNVPPAKFFDEIIAFGAAVLLPKPFGIQDFCPRAKRLAEIGKNRRLIRIEREQCRLNHRDQSRIHRPVFISYAHEDEQLANGIRIHIESLGIDVWYGPTTLDVGDEWQSEISAGVDNTSVFLPIITDHFLSSPMCLEELSRFQNRRDSEEQGNLLLLPIVGNLSSRGRTHKIFRTIAEKYHYIECQPHIIDCLTSLTMPIQLQIARLQKHHRRFGEVSMSNMKYSESLNVSVQKSGITH